MIFDPMTFDRSFGKRCRDNRRSLGLSQDEVCDALSCMGLVLSREIYSNIERGIRGVSFLEAATLSAVLNIDLVTFLPSAAYIAAAFALSVGGDGGNP